LHIAEALRAAHIEVWFDMDELRGGDVWDQKIRRQIRDCGLFIAVISANTQDRTEGYFRREWKMAVDRTQDMADDRAFIVPVLIDSTNEAAARVPEQFFKAHITRLPGGQVSPAFIAQIQRLLQSGGTSTPDVRPAERSAPLKPRVGRTRPLRAMSIAAIMLAILAGGVFWLTQRAPATGRAGAGAGTTAASSPDAKSIAVLPFLDMSEGKDQEYMSDGLAEELLNLLARVPALRVTSRSSAFSFKGKNLDAPEIARRLHVANILEGAVRKSGNRLRIDAQLIDGRTDSSLWSETYERTLNDIFAVQDEIAAAVVGQLKITLLGSAAPKATVTDPKAYALFLQARPLARQHSASGYEQSNALYQQALAIDANYAPAWDGLAYNYRRQANNGMRPMEEGYQLARDALAKALAADPNYAPSVAALGRIALDHDGDFATAARQLEHALSLAPTDADIVYTAARVAEGLGRLNQSMPMDEYALKHDPLNPTLQNIVGIDYRYAKRFDESIEAFRKVLQLSPGNISAHYRMGETLLAKGDYTAALTAIQEEPNDGWRLVGLPMAYYAVGDKASSDAALAELIQKDGQKWPSMVAYVQAYRGDIDAAFEWLDRAASAHDPSLATLVVEPLYAPLYKDPRWLPFLRKIGRAPEQLEAISFNVKPPAS
jgi:TolB-like protein/Tfp pilus assembly protein PilF